MSGSRIRRSLLWWLLIAAVVMSLALVACGEESAPSGDASASGAPSGDPIKVGAPLPLTGAYAADGQHMEMGLKLAVQDLNDQGGLLGRPVELVTYDIEELLPETVNAAADYMLGKEKVDVVVEGYGGYGPDFLAFGAKSDVPFLHGSGSETGANLVAEDPATYANMFQVFSIEKTYGERAWEGITSFEDAYVYPNQKIAILHGDLEWDLKYTAAVAEEAQAAGWEVVLNETFPYGTTDWGSVLAKIRAEEPAAIVCSVLSVKDISSFVNQFMEDPTPSLLDISYMMVFKETQDACGNNLTGVMGYVTSYVRPEIAGGDDWKARFKETFGMDVPLTTPPSTYDSVMIWADAVKAVGDPTKYAEISDYMRANPYNGLLGVYDFNNPQQTVVPGEDFPIAYAQYQGDGELAFFGTDPFIFPPYIQPAWPEK
jgi:ABC-type branched-subunit amino acid transport system substrate-binding protein